jgi:[ribosomal protein S18]-alanine N-acetyltransferase
VYYFIEPMVEADISQVQQVEQQSFSTSWSSTTFRRELRSPDTCRYAVARASLTPPPPQQRPRQTTPGRSGLLGALFPGLFGAAVLPDDPDYAYPVVGYGGIWLTVDDAHITTIAVAPQYRGQGLGELLLNGLIDQALDLQAAVMTLEVRVSNVVAQNLYAKYSFQVVGRRPRYYTDNGEDALIMTTDPIRTPEYRALLSELRRKLFARLRHQAEAEVAVPAGTRPETGAQQQGTAF